MVVKKKKVTVGNTVSQVKEYQSAPVYERTSGTSEKGPHRQQANNISYIPDSYIIWREQNCEKYNFKTRGKRNKKFIFWNDY